MSAVICGTIHDLVKLRDTAVGACYGIALPSGDSNPFGQVRPQARFLDRPGNYAPMQPEQLKCFGIIPAFQRTTDGVNVMKKVGIHARASRSLGSS